MAKMSQQLKLFLDSNKNTIIAYFVLDYSSYDLLLCAIHYCRLHKVFNLFSTVVKSEVAWAL
jgi:hypothetical protein